jgi:hypothetical protein
MALDLLKMLKADHKPGPGEFLNVDMPQLVEKLKLKERGAERRTAGLPSPDSRGLDDVEWN